jgi:hypothetical protein
MQPHPVHYVPADLSSFTKVVRLAIQDENQDHVRQMVKNANHWFRQKWYVCICFNDDSRLDLTLV